MSLMLFLLAQAGPLVSPGAAPPLNLPMGIDRDRPARRPAAPVRPSIPAPSRLSACLEQAAADPVAALASAEDWLRVVKGATQAEALLCKGAALGGLDRWVDAETAFIAGRDIAAASDGALRARLGAMAGNAALAVAEPARALALLDGVRDEVGALGDAGLIGDVAVDRARALVALKRDGEAMMALDEARAATPSNATAWLLSATLSRRMGKLAEAQERIAQAAALASADPEIGLEAGVIAMLDGREAAARRSWQSVVAIAPSSPAAQTAQGYLAQLGQP